jgi:hypothetical protein
LSSALKTETTFEKRELRVLDATFFAISSFSYLLEVETCCTGYVGGAIETPAPNLGAKLSGDFDKV